MLIQFSLENFLSFKNKNVLSMETGERLRKFNDTNTMTLNGNRLLKNVIIFGANGSGKSNLLSGLSTMRKMVLNPPSKITDELPYIPFFMDENSIHRPTTFEVEFIYNDKKYRYSFSYNNEQIISEKLEYSKGKKYISYFIRENGEFIKKPKNSENIFKRTRRNMLLLFTLQDSNDDFAIEVMEWFQKVLYFFDSSSKEDYYELLNNEKNKKLFLDFLKFADFNIIDVKVKTITHNYSGKAKKLISELMNEMNIQVDFEPLSVGRELRTVYKKYNEDGLVIGEEDIPISLESAGTRKIIDIALAMIACQNHNKILIFDEFDDSFHLNLSSSLIKIFNSTYNKNQFILTSHELHHLDCDIRKDQIYLTEKEFDGESHLFSLFDFNELNSTPRNDISFIRRYLDGQFGAIPNVRMEEMLETLSKMES